jgi:hypothetical protein
MTIAPASFPVVLPFALLLLTRRGLRIIDIGTYPTAMACPLKMIGFWIIFAL